MDVCEMTEASESEERQAMSDTSIFADFWRDDRIEREFTESGYECCTRTNDMGHRCGYVALPDSHPLFGMDICDVYENDVPYVDGGITFAKGMGGKWVFGWDAAHSWHRPDPSIMDKTRRELYEKYQGMYWRDADAVMIDADMAERETRNFAKKLRAMEVDG